MTLKSSRLGAVKPLAALRSVLFVYLLWAGVGNAQEESQPRLPELREGTQRLVIYLPERLGEAGTVSPRAIDYTKLRSVLPRYIKLPTTGTEFLHVYQTPLQRRLEEVYERDPRESMCGEHRDSKAFRKELDEVEQLLAKRAESAALAERLQFLLSRFHCIRGAAPVESTVLRRAAWLQAINWSFQQLPDKPEIEAFQQAFYLGDEHIIGDGMPEFVSERGDIWPQYIEAIQEFQRSRRPVDVVIDARKLPTSSIYLDGTLLQPKNLERAPLRLYPGRHFIQIQDSRKRVRSDSFVIPADKSRYVVTLGEKPLVVPELDEADEILWLGLRYGTAYRLPPWVMEALETLKNDYKLDALYVVATLPRRTNDVEGDLLIGVFSAGMGLIDIDPKERGEIYLSIAESNAYERLTWYYPAPWAFGIGAASFAGAQFVNAEFRMSFAPTDAFHIQAGALFYHSGLDVGHATFMSQVWAGAGREPTEPKLDWLAGVSVGLMVPGLAPATENDPARVIVRPIPRLLLGLEIPLQKDLSSGTGARLPKVWALRVELIGSMLYDLEPLRAATTGTDWMIEARLGLHLWRRRSLLD